MDSIQKILVEAGRKDLAQEYYKKIAIPAVVDSGSGDVAVETSDGKIKFTLVDRMSIDGEYRLVVSMTRPGMSLKPTTINTQRSEWRNLLEKSLVSAVESFERTLRSEAKLVLVK